MGLLGYLTGWEQDKAAGNAVLANHLLPYLDNKTREKITSYIVDAFRSNGRHTTEEIVRLINTESRPAQLNCVAMACASMGIEPLVNDGVGWRIVKQPHVAGSAVKPINMELNIKWLKKKTGVVVQWPGNDSKIDFVEWYKGQAGTPSDSTKPQRGEDVIATTAVPTKAAQLGWFARVELPTGRACDMKIPVGVKDGAQLRLRGLGRPGLNGGEPGDALITVNIAAE